MKRSKTIKKPTQAELRRLRAKVKKAKLEMIRARRNAENGIQSSIRQFNAVVRDAEKQLMKLKGTGQEAWKELKQDVLITWKDLKHFARKATSQLRI
jgi:hypothetical protein